MVVEDFFFLDRWWLKTYSDRLAEEAAQLMDRSNAGYYLKRKKPNLYSGIISAHSLLMISAGAELKDNSTNYERQRPFGSCG